MSGCLRVRVSKASDNLLYKVSSLRYSVRAACVSSMLIIKCKIYE
jgi:hypothetical protein